MNPSNAYDCGGMLEFLNFSWSLITAKFSCFCNTSIKLVFPEIESIISV